MQRNYFFKTLIILFFSFLNSVSQIQSIAEYNITGNHNNIKLGIDILLESDLKRLSGKRVFLLTNYTGRTSRGILTIDTLLNNRQINISGIMTPEHGIYTTIPAGKHVPDDKYKGLPVYSLFGSSRKPSKDLLTKCDVIIVDIQDIGIRSYTYISSLYNVMQSAAEYDKEVIVLDRPNPLGGVIVDGGTVAKGFESFVSIIPTSYIHGCTIGELAIMLNEEGWLSTKEQLSMSNEHKENNNKYNKTDGVVKYKCKLEIIKMEGWERWMAWEDTGLMWFPTSPHIPTVDAIRGAALLGVIGELGIISVGIGTTLPFQYFGFPGMKVENLNREFEMAQFSGIKFIPTQYLPFYGKFKGEQCDGFIIKFPLSNLFQPFSSGIKLILSLRKIHPEIFKVKNITENQIKMFNHVTGTAKLFEAIINGIDDKHISELSNNGISEYIKIRAKYLMY